VVGVLSALQASRVRSPMGPDIETEFPASSIKNAEGSFPLWPRFRERPGVLLASACGGELASPGSRLTLP
jgi:hypothetical protein